MRLKFLVETTVKIDRVSSKTYPSDWSGEVPDALAGEIIEQGLAVHIPVSIADLPPGQQFTAEQAAVLAHAADEALAAARADGEGTNDHQDIGDGEGDADEVDGEGPGTFDGLLKDELLELAIVAGIEGAKSMRKDELLEALKKHQAADV
jgi:hypothetical protein